VIRPEIAAEIVRLFSVEGWKVGTIARHLCVHHSTVARALERHGLLGERKCRRSMIDSFVPFIRDTFERYPRLLWLSPRRCVVDEYHQNLYAKGSLQGF